MSQYLYLTGTTNYYEQIFAPDIQNSTETKEVVVFTCISTLEKNDMRHHHFDRMSGIINTPEKKRKWETRPQ